MLPRVSSLALAGFAFSAGIAATLAVTGNRGQEAVSPARPAADAVAPPTVRIPAIAATPACAADTVPERPGCFAGARTASMGAAREEKRLVEIREDVAQAERDLAEEIAAGRAAAEGAPSEAEALGRAVAARTDAVEIAPPQAPVADQAPVRPTESPRAAPRPPRLAEATRRRAAEPASRPPRAVASAEGGIMRWLNTAGSF